MFFMENHDDLIFIAPTCMYLFVILPICLKINLVLPNWLFLVTQRLMIQCQSIKSLLSGSNESAFFSSDNISNNQTVTKVLQVIDVSCLQHRFLIWVRNKPLLIGNYARKTSQDSKTDVMVLYRSLNDVGLEIVLIRNSLNFYLKSRRVVWML